MAFYLQVTVNSPLSPTEFRERVIAPLGGLLQHADVGSIIGDEIDDNNSGGGYELSLKVTDQNRAIAIVKEFLASLDK